MEEPPRLERPLANISVKAGEPLRLSCRVVGTRPTIVWLHNSRNLADARDVQIYRDESSGECSIELREVFPRHAGIYTLLARNTQGETYTSCNVTLANKPPPETSDSELASDLEFSKPVVRKSLRDQTVNEGRSVRLDCIITGVPEPEVIWYHNGRPIKESSDVTFEFEGDHCSLIISSAQLSHLGSYRCKAVNPAGEATSLCKLIVLRQPPETSSRAGTPTGTSMEVACFENASGPARIVKPLSDVQIKHGEKFKLILGVECHPPPEVIWSFQGRPIVLDGDYIFDHVGTSYILDVPRATVDHAGVYSAEVRNAFGSQHSSCRVIVDPLPEDSLALVLAQAEAENAVSTHVTKSFVSSKRTMLMQKMSSSKSNVTADGRLVSSEEHQAATTEKYGFEKLGDAVPSEYHSKESFGFDRVGDNPPEHYYTKEVKDNRIQHKGKSATQLTIEGPAAEGTQPSVLSVPELAAQATNVTTRTSEPKQLSLLQRSGSAHIPPKFSKPLESVAVFAGEQVKLEGWFNGYPEPIVKWSRGSTTLSHKADLQITVEKSYTSLVIPKAMQKDHARYTCVISNDVGSSSSAADVVIQTKRVAPQFTRRLDARVCKSGSEITLEVEVSGAPSPDVKWLRDEIDLKTLNKYDIRSSANKHTLIIRRAEESDSGRYTVLATNIAGEAQSIADIFVEDEVSSEEEREVTIRDYHVQDEKKMERKLFSDVVAKSHGADTGTDPASGSSNHTSPITSSPKNHVLSNGLTGKTESSVTFLEFCPAKESTSPHISKTHGKFGLERTSLMTIGSSARQTETAVKSTPQEQASSKFDFGLKHRATEKKGASKEQLLAPVKANCGTSETCKTSLIETVRMPELCMPFKYSETTDICTTKRKPLPTQVREHSTKRTAQTTENRVSVEESIVSRETVVSVKTSIAGEESADGQRTRETNTLVKEDVEKTVAEDSKSKIVFPQWDKSLPLSGQTFTEEEKSRKIPLIDTGNESALPTSGHFANETSMNEGTQMSFRRSPGFRRSERCEFDAADLEIRPVIELSVRPITDIESTSSGIDIWSCQGKIVNNTQRKAQDKPQAATSVNYVSLGKTIGRHDECIDNIEITSRQETVILGPPRIQTTKFETSPSTSKTNNTKQRTKGIPGRYDEQISFKDTARHDVPVNSMTDKVTEKKPFEVFETKDREESFTVRVIPTSPISKIPERLYPLHTVAPKIKTALNQMNTTTVTAKPSDEASAMEYTQTVTSEYGLIPKSSIPIEKTDADNPLKALNVPPEKCMPPARSQIGKTSHHGLAGYTIHEPVLSQTHKVKTGVAGIDRTRENHGPQKMTMVQAEHIHREQTRVIERQVTPKPNIPALPAPAPPPSLDLLFKKDTSEQKETIIKTTVDPTKIQEPPLLPPPVKVESEQQITKRVDEEHRLEKHVHISQSIMRRQQQFVPPNVMEPVNLIFTPLPSTPTPISSDRVELPPRLPPQPPLSKPVAPTPAPPPSKPAQQPKSPPPRPELTKPKPLPIASPPPELVPPPWVQQRAEVKQQDIEQIKQQVIHQQQKIVLTPPVPPQPLPESLPPLQPPVATKVMSERKIEQTAQILKLEKMISSPPLVPLPQRVEPTRKTPEIVKPIKPIETSPSPVAPVQPKPKKLVKQQPKVVAESKPAPPPPPPQLPEIKPSQVKPKRASPPLRPPPPPKFRDEMLTYEAIRQQEMERIQRQCKKITLIEQCERQTTQVSDDRSMLIEQSFRKLQSPPRSPPPVLPPAASPVPSRTPHRPAEFHVVTRVFQKTRPLDLEEGITKFYKDYKETSKTVVTRTRTPSLPPERIPVVSVCHLSQPPFPLRKPSPEPFCRLEKSELRVEESRRQRSVSPCLLQEHIREVKRVLPPSPVCRVQEVDIHRKEVAPPPEHIDVLNLTSSVIHIERKPSPTPICTLREYGVHQTDKTYRDQTQLVDLREDCLARSRLPSPIPICQIKEVDHKVTDGRRLNTTVCVNLTEKQPVTPSNVKSVATDSADKIYTSKLSYVDLQEKQVSRPVPLSLPLLCRVQDKTRQFRSVTPPASIRCVDKTYSSISKIVDICRAPPIPSSSEDKVWIVQDNRGKVRRSASDSRRFDQNFNIQVTETTPVAAPPQIPVKTFQPVKQVTEGLPLHTTPASVQRFIRTAEWVEGAQSVDRNVLLTEQVKRKAPTDNQTTTSIVSQQDYSTPRQMEPLSTSVYVDQHTKVVSAPPIPPVQVTPSLPVIHRTDEVSTVSITMSDATPPSAPVQPVVPPSPKPAAMLSNAQNAKGQYSFRDFTDSKISRDTSSFVHLETHVDAISQTELQRATVTPRRQQPPPAAPSSFPTQEPVYQTLPSTNLTRSSSADFSLFTRHQLAQRKVDTTMSSRRDDIRMALSEKISNFKEREESRHIQAPCTLPHRRVACGTKTSLFTSGFEELSSPMQTETQATWPPRGIIKSAPSPVSKKKTVIIEEKPTHSSQVRPPWFLQPLVDRLERKGARITLTCIVEGCPMPTIRWFKDNMLLANGPDHQISFDSGIARLTIPYVFPQDSGRYVCTATNVAGSVITSCLVHVNFFKDPGMVFSPPVSAAEKRPHPLSSMTNSPPIWVRQPTGGRFIEGCDARFDATVSGNPMPQLVWSRRGLPIKNDHKRETGYNPITGETYLLIRQITAEDDGEYTCTAVNVAGEAILVVAVVRDFTAAQQMIQQRTKTTTINQQIGVSSAPFQLPPPQQKVVRSSSTVFSDLRQSYHNGADQAFRVDTFEYRLLREDEFRESLMKINIEETDVTEYREVVHKSRPLAPPQVQGRPRNSKLLAGSDATFQVRVPGNPDPRITWFRNGQRIKSSFRHVSSYSDSTATLTIRNCQADDAGYYTMLAENSKGRVATSVHLVIEDNMSTSAEYRLPSHTQSMTESAEIEDSQALKPSFIKLPTDREVTEGHQVRFDCRVSGRPTPEVLWYRNGLQVCDDNAHKILVNEGGLHALQINDAQASDAGMWTCVVRNKSGERRCDVTLTVIERELIVPPKFVERFQHVNVQEGEPVSLHCRAVGTPMPQLLWLKDGVQIHSAPPHVLIEATEGCSSLHIDRATLADGAWYQCTATNQAGSTATRARLHVEMLPRQLTTPWSLNLPPATTVIEPQQPPAPETVVLKHWERPRTELSKTPEDAPPQKPAFTSHLQDLVVTEGERAHFEARLIPIGDPTLVVEWFVNGRPIEAGSRVMTVNRFGYVALTMLNTYCEDGGVILCRASNQAGEATVSASLKVMPRPAVDASTINADSLIAIEQLEQHQRVQRQFSDDSGPQQKPTFIKPLENLENIIEGSFARFEAQIQPVNDPTMRVEWFVNGRPLTSSSRINTTFSFGYVALNISTLRYEDSGVYMVKATNARGDALSTATLKVVSPVMDQAGNEEQQRYIQQLESYRETQHKTRHEWQDLEEPSQAPVFKSQPRDQQNVQEGKTVLFEARLEPSEDSSMRVEWFKDGKPLEASSRTYCTYSFGYVSLRISQVEERDSGTYTVQATNRMGIASATANLTCISTKVKTGSTLLQHHRQGLERTQHIEDYSHYDRKQEEQIYAVTQRPQFLEELKGNGMLVEGQSAHFETRLEPMGDSSMTVEWYHNGKPLITGHRFKTYSDFGYVALDVLYMYPEDSGTFTVVARNEMGEARLSKQVTVQAQSSIDSTSITDIISTERSTRHATTHAKDEDMSSTKPYFTTPLKDIHKPYNEDDKVFLECKVEPASDPTLKIEWLYNGRPLTPASRIITKTDFGHIILQINGVTEEDSGQYTVRATNHLGSTLTSASIKVIGHSGVISESQYPEGLEKIQRLESRQRRKEEDLVQVFGRPEFRKPLHNIETCEGNNVHLECRLEPAQDPSLRVEWYKNNLPITVGHRFRPAHEFDYVALDILSAYAEDGGVYTCRAVNKQGEITTSCSVQVISIGQIVQNEGQNSEVLRQIAPLEHTHVRESYHEELLKTKPQFISQPKPQSLTEGQSAHFECRLEPVNDPDLKVEWYKDGRPLPIGHRFRPFHDFGYVALNILSVTSADSGCYSCRATNRLGTAEVSTTLTATDESSIITTTENPDSIAKIAQLEGHRFAKPEITDQAITTAPVFTVAPQNANVVEGARTHFECRLIPVGDPRLKVEWLHNGQPVKQGSRFVELFNFGFVALDIMTTHAEDSGVYTCRATNALGEAIVSANLSCASQQSLILDSQQPDSLAQIRYLEDHTRYQHKSYQEETQTQAPVFSNPMRNVTIRENGNAHFECRLTPLGDPKMKVEWLKNGIPLNQSSRISTVSDFGFIALDLKGAKVEDTGTYTCRAVNEIGEAVCSAQLVVQGESSLVLTSLQPDSLYAIQQLELGKPRAAPKEDAPCKAAPRFVTQLTGPLQVVEGQAAHYECHVEPFPDSTMKYEWLHNGQPLEQGHRFRTVTDFGFVALDILSARPDDSGEYTIRATNQLGQAVSSINLQVAATGSLILESQQPESLDAIRRLEGTMGYQRAEFIEKTVNERPQFVRGLNNLDNLTEGQSAHLEATITPTNDPKLKIEWLHNGTPVAAGARHRTVCDFGYVALDITHVQPRDSGVYMCKATNALGEAVTSSQVRVTGKAGVITDSNISEDGLQRLHNLDQPASLVREEKPVQQVKPVFTQPLTSVDNLVEGQPIHLECRVEPINDSKLKIEWFVNGVEIKQGSRFRTTSDFGYVALDILHCYGEDSGTYMCKASNELGEAVTTCNVSAKNRRSLILDTQHPQSVQRIQELESIEKFRKVEIEDKPVSKPAFITELRGPTQLIEGQIAHMECRVEPAHDSNLKIEVFHNGKPLQAANKTRITTDFGYVAIDLAYVYPENSGNYTVRATNRLGTAQTAMDVTVQGKSSVQLESLHPQSMQSIREIEGKINKTDYEVAAPVFQRPEFTQPLKNADLTENQPCRLEARLIPVGDPTMKIEWLINDQPINEGSRMHAISDFGFMSLTIDYVRPEDQGVYTCRATSSQGQAVTSCNVKIKGKDSIQLESQQPQSLQAIRELETGKVYEVHDAPAVVFEKPVFTEPLLGPSEINENTAVRLACRCTPIGDPDLKFQWLCNGNVIENASRMVFNQDFGHITLDIQFARGEDSGVYMCKAMNRAGEAVTSTSLRVKTKASVQEEALHPEAYRIMQQYEYELSQKKAEERPDASMPCPVFIKQLESVKGASEGQYIRLEGRVEPSKDSKMKVEWYKNQQPLTFGARIKAIHDFGMVSLDISGARSEDSGLYTCHAVNESGEAISTCTVKVEGSSGLLLGSLQPESLERIREMEAYQAPTPREIAEPVFEMPVFVSHINDLELTEGQHARFECRVEPAKDPTLKVEFLHNQQPLRSGSRITTKQDFGLVTIDIQGISSNDVGIYSVRATNNKGQATTTASLKVIDKAAVQLDTLHPTGEQGLSSIQKVEDTWSTKYISVKPVPEKVFNKPVFTQLLEPKLTVDEGRSVTLECRVEPSTDPDLKVEVFFNGKALEEANRFLWTNEFGYVNLTIKDFWARDSGVYTIQAENKVGKAFTTTTIECKPAKSIIETTQHPEGAKGLESIQSLEESMVKTTEQTTEERGQAPLFTSQFTNLTDMTEGEIAHFEAMLSPVGDQTMTVEWLFNGRPIEMGHRIRTVHAFGIVLMEILGVVIEDSGKYTCQAKNAWGTAEISVDLKCVDKQKGQRPKFTTPLSTMSGLREGESVHIECHITPVGDPDLRVEWFKNGEPLPESSRIKTLSDFGFVVMDISYVHHEDSGEYVCVATNKYGSDTTKCTIDCASSGKLVLDSLQPRSMEQITRMEGMKSRTVTKVDSSIQEAPKFVSHIQNVTGLMEGQSAHFECQLTPINDPDLRVEWYFNGQLMRSGHRFRTFHDFGVVVLDILYCYGEDSGEWVCKATNKHGTDITRATLTCKSNSTLILESQLPVEMAGGQEKLTRLERSLMRSVSAVSVSDAQEAPVFTKPLDDIPALREGENMHLEAHVTPTHDSDLTVEWFKDGATLRSGTRIRTINDFGFVVLELSPVYPEDSGVYTCKARNRFGEAVTSCTVHCESKRSIISDTQLPLDMRDGIHKMAQIESRMAQHKHIEQREYTCTGPPQFLSSPSDLSLVENGLAHFECRVGPANDPNLRVDWFHNGKPLVTGSRVKSISDFGFVILEIAGVYSRDAGVYTCRAVNREGEASVSCQLSIKSKQSIVLDSQLPEGFTVDGIKVLEESRYQKTSQTLEGEKREAPKFVTQLTQTYERVEGDNAHFECKLLPVGDPTMKVEWFVNGAPLITGSRVHTVDDFGFVVLEIDWLFPRDSGEYMCRATNKWGSDTTKCTLTVKSKANIILESQLPQSIDLARLRGLENPPTHQTPSDDKPPTPPHFITQIQPQHGLKEGDSAHFECRLEPTSDPKLRVEWFHNGSPLISGHRYKTTHDFGFVALDILYCYAEDSGEYVAKAVSELGSDQTRATLECMGKPKLDYRTQLPMTMKEGVRKIAEMEITKQRTETVIEQAPEKFAPMFVQKPEPQVVVEGEWAKFQCRVIGHPKPRLIWVLNGNSVVNGSRYKLTFDGIYHFDIPKTRQYDGGKVEVFARNAEGEAYCFTTLEVRQHQSDYRAVLKQSPNPWYDRDIRSYQVDRQKKEEKRIFEEVLPGGQEVNVWKTERTAQGEKKQVKQQVTTEELDKIHEMQASQTSKTVTEQKSSMIQQLSSQQKLIQQQQQIKQNIMLRQQKAGEQPTAPAQSFGQAISSTVQGKMVTQTTQQQIQKHFHDDLEIHKRKKVTETVEQGHKGVTTERVVEGPVQPAKAPQFSRKIQPCRVTEGESAKFECEFTGDPPPEITWYRENFTIKNSKDFQITTTASKSVLIIREVYLEDSGVFSVKAENRGGSAKTSANLVVQERQEAGAGMAPPNFTKTIQSQRAKQGMTIRLSGCISGGRPMDIYWLHSGQKLTEDERHKIHEEADQCTLVILNAVPEDSANYECVALNKAGEARCMAQVVVEPSSATTAAAVQAMQAPVDMSAKGPQVTDGIKDLTVKQGQPATFRCRIPAAPTAQVKWYRGDNLIKQSRYYKLSGENHVYTLKISEVFPEDEGEYRCEATNRAGTASTSAFLKVIVSDGNESPPTLGHLSDLTATEGQSVTFTTQLAGTPRPKVTWYKGGQVIRPTRDFQITQDETSCSLVIRSVLITDEGTYICRATNPGGQAEAAAKLTVHRKARS
ncbi:titin-like isoform X6 [Varroa destructor]|uniref:Ig-like domain-containing protein n=1 Tax=Varroa destructor TaxID=109461 RepID=A0A7M7KQV9_VARDE|nr:titin-like isoform X6 [Varroa destructor]